MGRARLRLELLRNEKARRKTYKIRKKGLEKKANDLCTLCEVDLCMIMYPPALKDEEIEPFVWSNNPDQVPILIESHKFSRLGDESRSRTYDLASFYKDQTGKVKQEIEKLRKKNRELKYPNWDERYNSLSHEELKNLTGILTAKINAANDWITFLKERKVQVTESSVSMNPIIQENPGSNMLEMVDRRFEQYALPYFDAEYQSRMLATMMMNNGASCNINNATFNYSENGIINVNPSMSYNVETISDQEPQHIGQGLMMNNPTDYFPHMDAAYGEDYSRMAQNIGQGLMVNNPTDYFPSDGCIFWRRLLQNMGFLNYRVLD